MWATNSSNLPLVSFLLSHGADIEAKSSKGATCEDFIISSSPETFIKPLPTWLEPGPSHRAALGLVTRDAPPASPRTTDRELIADIVFEYQQATAKSKLQGKASVPQHLRSLSMGTDESSPARPASPGLLSPPSMVPDPVTPSKASSKASLFGHSRTMSASKRRLVGRDERTQIAEAELRAREVAEGRRRGLLDMAVMLGVEYDVLVGEPPVVTEVTPSAMRKAKRRGTKPLKPTHSGLASGCGAAEIGGDVLSIEFDFETVRADQMLVFGEADLEPLLDLVVTKMRPVRAPWTHRSAPANVLFLCIRFACSLDDYDLLEGLLLGAADHIEEILYAHSTDMTYLAFWLHNCMLLLHYMQRDVTLRHCEALDDLRSLVADLINELYVFVIRDLERRIDKVMDAALLEHDAIPGMEDVKFEGEWTFIKTLTGSVKNLGQGSHSSSSAGGSVRKPLGQIFAARSSTPEANSDGATMHANSSSSPAVAPVPSPGTPSSRLRGLEKHTSSPATTIASIRRTPSVMRESSYDATPEDLLAKPSPRTITSLLTSTLHVLQLYEVNPAVIIQALSQVFFWVGCELFNRVLTRKKYLCRSRAMQIRLSVSALEDWARSNALPLSIVNSHLAPLNQLISWLQCLSSLKELDGLIATLQGLRVLNPVQMKRAARDYRYEVGETRLGDECVQYLDQLHVDWERRRQEVEQARRDAEEEEEAAKKLEQRQEEDQKRARKSAHGRSGTATQANPSGNEDELEEGEGEGDEGGDDTLDSNTTARTATADDVKASATSPRLAQHQNPNESIARTAQRAIDSLFDPGRSMSDYKPPWSAAGQEQRYGQTEANTAHPQDGSGDAWILTELLNSRDMLPFALPSKAEALIVSPGDAFGFGRGHFQGTGTPSLKSLRGGPSPLMSAAPSPLASRSTTPLPALVSGTVQNGAPGSGEPQAGDEGEDDDEDRKSTTTSSSLASGLSASSTSSLYPLGRGFAAGAYWQPVPLLPDGMLENIDDVMQTSRAKSAALVTTATHAPSADAELARSATLKALPPPPLPSRNKHLASLNVDTVKKAEEGHEAAERTPTS